MFIIFGFGHKTVKNYGEADKRYCQRCHNDVDMRLLKVTTWFTLFFIPIIPYRKIYLLTCTICSESVQLSRDEFEAMRAGDTVEISNPYHGKTETQINYLRQMEELEKERAAKGETV